MTLRTAVQSMLPIIVFAVAFHLFIHGKSKIEVGNNDIHNVRMPVEGVWKVIRSPGHDTFAFDLTKIDKASHKKLSESRFQHLLGNTRAEDWYSWNKVVYSPADGPEVNGKNRNR
jgi:hypothetical protein